MEASAKSAPCARDDRHARRYSRTAPPSTATVLLPSPSAARPCYGAGVGCPQLGAKLLDGVLHWRRQVSPVVDRAAHGFFDGSHHALYCNVTVGSRHGAAPSVLT